MSLEAKIEELIAAVRENTAAIVGTQASGAKSDAKEERPTRDDAKAERGSSRRSAAKDKDEPKGVSEAELKEKVAKFLDLPETSAGNTEYEKRLEKVIDPIFNKADVKELADLPEKCWSDLLDAIADYEKASADTGSRRRR